MANPLGDPIPIDETNTEPVEQTREVNECPECSGRANDAGSTANKQFYKCPYCGNSFNVDV